MSKKNLTSVILAYSLWANSLYDIANSRDRHSVIFIPKRKKKKAHQKKGRK
jgi:hypothetical protein